MENFQQPHQPNSSYDLPPITNPPTQFFGSNGTETSPIIPTFEFQEGQEGREQDDGHDENDPKRRRIARVRRGFTVREVIELTKTAGLRHVPEEEDQV